MSRPTTLLSGNTLYWTIRLYNDSQVLVDADSTPTVAVRKNGASVGDAVTVTKRSATTGIYDCSYNPAGEVEGDQYTLEESATVSAVAYESNWSVVVEAVERGTDGANTVTPVDVSADVTAVKAKTDQLSFTVANQLDSNIVSVSGDSTAADNIESQYDGVTGLSGDVFPATQASVANIGSGTAGAVNFEASFDNTSAPIKGVSFVGSVASGTLENTAVEDNVAYEIDDVGNDIDIVFGYDVGGDNQGVEVEVVANVNGNADSMVIKAYNFNASDWDTIGTITGSGGTSYTRLNLSLLARHTGTGADLGNVYIRFDTEATTPANLLVDKVIVGSVTTTRSVGYSNGSIWISSTNGVAGTEPFVNGVADNPCLSYANAISIASAVGLSRYTFDASDSITLTQGHPTDSFSGYNYQLDMNNQAPPTYVEGAEIIGTCNGPAPHYVRDCRIGTASTPLTLNKGAVFVNSGLVNVDLLDQAAAALDIEFLDCHGNTQGSMFPGGSVDFGTTAGTNHEVSFQRWGGPVTIVNLKDGDTVYAHGNGTFILDASCTGGDFRVAGMINLVDNSGGAVAVLEDGRITKSGIADAVWDEVLADHLDAGSTGEALNAAGASGDPWTTSLPGSYTGSQAGKVLADVLEDTGTTLPVSIDNIDTIVDLIKVDTTAILADTGTTIPAQITALNDPTAAEIADAVWDEPLSAHITAGSAGIYLLDSGLVAAKLDSALEADGSGGWQYTTLALENAPSDGGGGTTDWTAAERSQIRYMLGIDGTTAVPSATSGIVTATWGYDDGNGLGDKSGQVYATLTEVLNIENVTDRLDGMLVLNGEGTSYQYTVDALENAPAGGDDASVIYSYFTASGRETPFQADTSGLATSANLESVALVTLDTNTKVNVLPTAQEIVDEWGNQPQGVYVTPDTLGFYLDAQVSTAGSGGTGLYQATVLIQDTGLASLQGARVNIGGTTLTLTTGTDGTVVFNLDAGIYTLDVSPPAGYDTPASQVLTITGSDTNSTFTLTETTPSEGCDIPWLG